MEERRAGKKKKEMFAFICNKNSYSYRQRLVGNLKCSIMGEGCNSTFCYLVLIYLLAIWRKLARTLDLLRT